MLSGRLDTGAGWSETLHTSGMGAKPDISVRLKSPKEGRRANLLRSLLLHAQGFDPWRL